MKYILPYIVFSCIGLLLFFSSCKKPLNYSKDNLNFSKDTVLFDTVFTTIGSTTQQLKIYNTSKNTVKIEEIQLMGGTNSPFRINVDGIADTDFSGLELEGNDSLYTFIEVTLDPNDGTLPMVVEDSIRFQTNGSNQYVQLVAWGQDVYYHYSNLNTGGELNLNEGTWANDKPHLIYGAAFVDENKQLTIPAGTQVYLHHNSFLYVYKGTLNIEGELGNEVTFQGDRLEADYDDVSGQYYGIYLDSALSSTVDYAIIKNAVTGIHIEGNGINVGTPTLTLSNTIISNCARYGVLNFFGGELVAENTLIYKCGFHSFFNLAGAKFDFNHCNLVGYGNAQEQLPSVAIADYHVIDGIAYTFTLDGNITNSVLHGNQESEIVIDTVDSGHSFNIDYNLIQRNPQGSSPLFNSTNIWNTNPQFTSVEENDFLPINGSILQNNAFSGYPTSNGLDLLGNSRNISTPDIGVYEF